MVTTAEHREVRERGGPALGPVTNVMALAERQAAPWKPAAAVAMVQRAAERWGNGPRPGAKAPSTNNILNSQFGETIHSE